jgi:hypothetical protein
VQTNVVLILPSQQSALSFFVNLLAFQFRTWMNNPFSQGTMIVDENSKVSALNQVHDAKFKEYPLLITDS